MRGGRLRHRLLLQQKSNTRDSLGGVVKGWSTTATVWGAVEDLFGMEAQTADALHAEMTTRIIIRHDSSWSAIDTSWRIKDKNTLRKFDVKQVLLPESRTRPNTMIEIMCKEGSTDDE